MTDAALMTPITRPACSGTTSALAHSGSARDPGSAWAGLLTGGWLRVIEAVAPGSKPRAVQRKALEAGLLTNRRNLIVTAPTNSGKSLVGTLVLLDAVRQGKRAVLIEPLRALANEQADNLRRMLADCTDLLGVTASVRVTTGDYRLQAEEYSDPAPAAELVVCTPERLDAILRNPANQPWVDSLGAVVLDEAHLIAQPRRGPTQEFLLTSLLLQPSPPRLALLSATLGDTSRAREWLAPCDVIQVTERYPPLTKGVLAISHDQSANGVIADWLRDPLATPDTQALVFVYQTRSTGALAQELTDTLGALAGVEGAVAYHGQMPAGQREAARTAFLQGRSRVVVTTSALAMGVNLPATHVAVRDLTYPGARSPGVEDLLQMMGRAGRGDQAGQAVAVLRPEDDWDPDQLRAALEAERLPEFRSALALDQDRDLGPPRAAPLVASLLSRAGEQGHSADDLMRFMAMSLGGKELSAEVAPALQWLARKALAYQIEGRHHLTVLGRRATRSVLPLPLAAGLAQLVRDLLSVDPRDQELANWQELDHLLVLHALNDGGPSLRRFSKALADQVTGWCQGTPSTAPVLFRHWIDGEKGYSKASEVLSSLGLQAPRGTADKQEWARQQGYLATFHAIVLHERGQGRPIERLARQFKVQNLEGKEERWRDDLLWLLAGVAKLLEVRTFYFHLREECGADPARIKRVKRLLARMRHQTYDLQEKLKYCSPLGPVLRDMRRLTGGGIGEKTIRTLEYLGVTDLATLSGLGVDGMVRGGVRRDIASRVHFYLKRRAF